MAAEPENVAVNRGGRNYDEATAAEMLRAQEEARKKAAADAAAKAAADAQYLDFQIGRNPGYVEGSANRARGLGQEYGDDQTWAAARTRDAAAAGGENLQGQGDAATQYGYATGNAIYDQAGYLRDTGRGIASLGDWAATRGPASSLNFGDQNYLLGAAEGNAGNLAGLEATQGPSGAQALLQQGANQSMAQSLALSRSGRGFGGSAAAQSGALAQNAATMQQAGNAAAMLNAQENEAWRARQAQNLGAAAGIYQGNAAQYGQEQALAADTALQSRAQNDALQTNLYQIGTGAQTNALGAQTAAGELGLKGAATGADIYGRGVDTTLKGEELASDIRTSGYEGEQKGALAADTLHIAQNESDRDKERMLADVGIKKYGIDKGVEVAENQADNSLLGGIVSGAGTAAAALASFFTGSDERAKMNIKPATSSSFASGPADRSDLSPWGKSGQGAYDVAMKQQAKAQAAEAEEDMARRGNIMAGVNGLANTAQAFAAPLKDDGSFAAYNKIASMGGYQASDEYSKRLTSDDAPSATLEAAEATTPYSYEYKDPERFGSGRQFGIMAQDLETTPAGAAVVKEAPDGTKMIDTTKLTTQNTASIGELSRRLDALAGDVSTKGKRSAETTTLKPGEEEKFRNWAAQNSVRDVDHPDSFYDYRGFWQDQGGPQVRGGVDHFPDTYKQHGHPTFSNESRYSEGGLDGGRWLGDDFVDLSQQREALTGPSAVSRAYGRGEEIPQRGGGRRLTSDEQTMRELDALAGDVGGRSYAPPPPAARPLTSDERLLRELDALERLKSREALTNGQPRQAPRRSLARSRQPASASEELPWRT